MLTYNLPFTSHVCIIGVANLMQQLVSENKLSSVHVNFMRKEEISAYLSTGYKLRETIQYR